MDFAERLIPIGRAIFDAASLPVTQRGASDIKVLAVSLLARTVSNLRGTIILLRERRIVEARTVARCCYENYFWIGGLVKEGDDFVRHMLNDEMKRRQMRGEHLMRANTKLEAEVEEKLRNWMKATKKEFGHAQTLNPKEVAFRGPANSSYVFYGQLSSDSAHPSVDALNRYIASFDENNNTIRAIDLEPNVNDEEIIDTLNLASLVVIGVYAGVNEIVGFTSAGEALESLANEYTRLSDQRRA